MDITLESTPIAFQRYKEVLKLLEPNGMWKLFIQASEQEDTVSHYQVDIFSLKNKQTLIA